MIERILSWFFKFELFLFWRILLNFLRKNVLLQCQKILVKNVNLKIFWIEKIKIKWHFEKNGENKNTSIWLVKMEREKKIENKKKNKEKGKLKQKWHKK